MNNKNPFSFEDLIKCFEAFLDEYLNPEVNPNDFEAFLEWAKEKQLLSADPNKVYEGRKWFTGMNVIR